MSPNVRSRLEDQKRGLYDAIRTLERDSIEGNIDTVSYLDTRRRYEQEAAAILERLDLLEDLAASVPSTALRSSKRHLVVVATGGAVVLAIAVFLGSALRARTGTAAITGDVGQAAPAPVSGISAQVQSALGQIVARPWDPNAELALATAYINAKDNRQADLAYRRAIQLGPRRPEARTMYAMFQGSQGNTKLALAQLVLVEREHPAFARAWLIDGLLSSRVPAGLPRAIRSWHTFLVLSPRVSIAPQVQTLLASAERIERRKS